jgi:hypothetical protein
MRMMGRCLRSVNECSCTGCVVKGLCLYRIYWVRMIVALDLPYTSSIRTNTKQEKEKQRDDKRG